MFRGFFLLKYIQKKSIIDQHLARHFVNYVACLSSPPHFLCSQIITPFIYSMISTNQKTGLYFQPIVEYLYPYSSSSAEFFLYIPLLQPPLPFLQTPCVTSFLLFVSALPGIYHTIKTKIFRLSFLNIHIQNLVYRRVLSFTLENGS